MLTIRTLECQNCHKKQYKMYKLVIKNKSILLCNYCVYNWYSKMLKNSQLDDSVKNSREWKDGARDIDFKSYVEKWIKNKTTLKK